MKKTNKLLYIFTKIDDPRRYLTNQTPPFFLLLFQSSVELDSWNEMELYAQGKEGFLRTFLELPNGIPSQDTINRIFSAIDSGQFELGLIL